MSRIDLAAIESRSGRAPNPRPFRAILFAVLVVGSLLLLAARMVPHPVGAARTFGKYNGKAVTTADSARASVSTAALMAQTYADGGAFTSYAALVADDAESALASLQGTFDSIQPPDARADRLSEELDALLGVASSHVRDLRVTLRRSEQPTAEQIRALEEDVSKLSAFISEHG